MRYLAAAAAVLTLTVAAPAQAKVAAGSQTLVAGAVRATLSWQGGEFTASGGHLRVERAGAVALDVDLGRECQACDALGEQPARALLHAIRYAASAEAASSV